MRIATVVGARPQFIKCSELSKLLREQHKEILIHTGQHYDPNMSSVFFSELGIPKPDYNLNAGSELHGKQTGEMLQIIEAVLIREKPDLVLVYGDTNSTIAGAMAAVKLKIPVAHIEAGLRSFDKGMPEEINRVLTDHISTLLFCPTLTAACNLSVEGIRKNVYLTGDVMADSVARIRKHQTNTLDRLHLKPKTYAVLTIHRPDNSDSKENIKSIFSAIEKYPHKVIFPVHPRTSKNQMRFGIDFPKNSQTLSPLGYLDMITLMANADRVITDSGGMQKEAYMLGVPCITLRDRTEWTETLEDNWNILTGSHHDKIVDAFDSVPTGKQQPIFPEGASKEIVEILSNWERAWLQ
jgi:UDP-N-acetylglucosamine 2-epimerase (non-hydrolysing)